MLALFREFHQTGFKRNKMKESTRKFLKNNMDWFLAMMGMFFVILLAQFVSFFEYDDALILGFIMYCYLRTSFDLHDLKKLLKNG